MAQRGSDRAASK